MPKQEFTTRQYMVTPDYEFFHYKDKSTMEIDYHNHDFFEIFFFISGRVVYVIEGKSYRLMPGDILLISNREVHKPLIEAGEAYERIVLWVNPGFILRHSSETENLFTCFESSSRDNYNLLRPHSELHSILRTILIKFEKVSNNAGFGSRILGNTYLTELLVYLNRAYLDARDNDIEIEIEYDEKVNNILKYINENLANELTLDILSSRFYLSKYHLLREFKKHAGYTIHQYIQKKRLIMAKTLLREGAQVSEVCIQCGFGDYSNFIRSFRKAFGMSPRKYYKSHLV